MGFNWFEAKAFIKAKKDSEEFLRIKVNQEFDELEDKEKKDLNTMALWEFSKPINLRIPAHVLIEVFKNKKELLTVTEKNS